MANLTHFTPKAGAPPYKSLFSTVTLVPANTSLAYISSQWAADAETGELTEGTANDYGKQAFVTYQHIVGILKELGATAKDIVHRTVSFNTDGYREFNDEIGRVVIENMIAAMPEEWRGDALSPALAFNGPAVFHRPGMVYVVDLVVAVPGRK
ncbi:hypothetical protein VTL71DRAFT_9590 [Oculimacula yallundae]|uniref:YjgF-like protein n=1 Tax=Oculimacula yallundae TaxID=86028 RepID=A0ABR4BRF3_9HELO